MANSCLVRSRPSYKSSRSIFLRQAFFAFLGILIKFSWCTEQWPTIFNSGVTWVYKIDGRMANWRRRFDRFTRMVRFIVSSEIRGIIEEYNTTKKVCKDDDEYLDPEIESIEHVQLTRILTFLQSRTTDPAKKPQYSLHKVLKSTSLHIEPPPLRKPVNPPSSPITSPVYSWRGVMFIESGISSSNGVPKESSWKTTIRNDGP